MNCPTGIDLQGEIKMAKKTNTTIKNDSGKEYNYFRFEKTIGTKINKDGEVVPNRVQFTGKTKTEAEAKYNLYLQSNAANKGADESFGVLVENWFYDFFGPDSNYTNGTKARYYRDWEKNMKNSAISAMKLKDVTAQTIQSFYNSLDCSTSAIRRIHNLLRQFFRYCEMEGIGRDCTGVLKVPQKDNGKEYTGEDNVIVWDDAELEMIMSSFDMANDRFRLRFLIVAAYNTGCRIGELLGLKYSDFSVQERTVKILRQVKEEEDVSRSSGKTHTNNLVTAPLKTASSRRTIPLNEVIISEFKHHKKWHEADMKKNNYRTEYVFTTSTGKFYDKKNIRRGLYSYYDAIGIEPVDVKIIEKKGKKKSEPVFKSIHTYRHTFATNLAKKGVPIQTVSALLGHSDINMTTKYYIGIAISDKMKAVELLGITNEDASSKTNP